MGDDNLEIKIGDSRNRESILFLCPRDVYHSSNLLAMEINLEILER